MNMNTIHTQLTEQAIVEGVHGLPDAGQHLRKGLQNLNITDDWHRGLDVPKGIVLCYGDDEGMAAIVRAYQNLQVPASEERFAQLIAAEFKAFAGQFPAHDHNLCYAHFLLHGLRQNSAEQVAAKIADNARIIAETGKMEETLLGMSVPECRVQGYRFRLERGVTDDYQGISFVLESRNSTLTLSPLAKAGFFIDATNAQAVVINVQGRKNLHRKPEALDTNDPRIREGHAQRFANYRRAAEEGRMYARFGAAAGLDPRSYVLTELFGMLKQAGVSEVKVIRPSEHVMHIGNHPGFRAAYESVLHEAGMTRLDSLYYGRKLTDPGD